jgi:hypothetical protein
MKEKEEEVRAFDESEKISGFSAAQGKAKGYFKMAGATAAFTAFLYMVMFQWGYSEPKAYVGPGTLEKGKIATKGSSLKSIPWVLSYTVKVPSKYPGYVALRTIYARKNACGKESLTVGETVWLTSYFRKDRKFARRAVTEAGCVLQDDALIADIRKANDWNGVIGISVFVVGTAYLIFAGFLDWFRTRRNT